MQVMVSSATSRTRVVTSGVAQGSVLGPVLFLIYINHVTTRMVSCYKAFADDCKSYLSSKREYNSAVDGVSVLQRDFDRNGMMSASWNLTLNTDKCVTMRFCRGSPEWTYDPEIRCYLDSAQLKFVESHRDLGVTVDTSLKFHQNIKEVVKKASGLASSLL